MNEPTPWIVLVGLVVFGTMLWKSMSIMKAVALSGFRAQNQERGDYFRLLTQIIEKANLGPNENLDMARIHAEENSRRMANETQVEKAIADVMKPPTKPDMVHVGDTDPEIGGVGM
jgi:hypothetical protein